MSGCFSLDRASRRFRPGIHIAIIDGFGIMTATIECITTFVCVHQGRLSLNVSRNKCPRAGSFRHPGVSASTCTCGIQCRSPFQYSLCVKAQPAAWVTFIVVQVRGGALPHRSGRELQLIRSPLDLAVHQRGKLPEGDPLIGEAPIQFHSRWIVMLTHGHSHTESVTPGKTRQQSNRVNVWVLRATSLVVTALRRGTHPPGYPASKHPSPAIPVHQPPCPARRPRVEPRAAQDASPTETPPLLHQALPDRRATGQLRAGEATRRRARDLQRAPKGATTPQRLLRLRPRPPHTLTPGRIRHSGRSRSTWHRPP